MLNIIENCCNIRSVRRDVSEERKREDDDKC